MLLLAVILIRLSPVPDTRVQGPLTNAVVLNLVPLSHEGGDLERGADLSTRDNGRTNRLPDVPANSPVVFILGSTADQHYSHYRARFLGRSGTPLWPENTLRRDPTGSFSMILQRQNLPEIPWSINVYGTAAGVETLLETYPIEPAKRKG